jgi:Rrf2 family protein
MKMTSGVEAALHSCLIMHWREGTPVTSGRLATFFALPPAYLQKTLRALVAESIVGAARGKSGGFVLIRPSESISLMDVVSAIEGRSPLFHCAEIRLDGQSGQLGPRSGACSISHAMHRAEMSYRRALAAQSIADLAQQAGSTVRERTLSALS